MELYTEKRRKVQNSTRSAEFYSVLRHLAHIASSLQGSSHPGESQLQQIAVHVKDLFLQCMHHSGMS